LKIRLQHVCLFSAIALTAPASAGESDQIADQLIKLNSTLQVATKNYDIAVLNNLVSNDYELVSSHGKVYDRAAFLKDAADRSAVYEINQPEDVAVRHYNGDCAIVTAVLHVRYRTGGKTVDVRIRYGDTWVKLNGTWRYVYGQASPMKAK
jgi:ketosteroid isomerase-like protein